MNKGPILINITKGDSGVVRDRGSGISTRGTKETVDEGTDNTLSLTTGKGQRLQDHTGPVTVDVLGIRESRPRDLTPTFVPSRGYRLRGRCRSERSPGDETQSPHDSRTRTDLLTPNVRLRGKNERDNQVPLIL